MSVKEKKDGKIPLHTTSKKYHGSLTFLAYRTNTRGLGLKFHLKNCMCCPHNTERQCQARNQLVLFVKSLVPHWFNSSVLVYSSNTSDFRCSPSSAQDRSECIKFVFTSPEGHGQSLHPVSPVFLLPAVFPTRS